MDVEHKCQFSCPAVKGGGNFTYDEMAILEENWRNIRQDLLETVELVDSFGFDNRTLQATNSLLPIASYLYRTGGPRNFGTSDHYIGDRGAIRGWLTRSILKESGIWGSGPDTLLKALSEVIRNSETSEFPAEELRRVMAQRGKTLDSGEEEIEDLAEMRAGDRRVFPQLSILFPDLRSRDGSDVDQVFPESRFAPNRLKAAGVGEKKVNDYCDRCERIANLQLLDRSVNNEKRATMPAEWLDVPCPTGEARRNYCAGHQPGDLPGKVTGFPEFYKARRRRVWAMVVVLCHSRHCFLWPMHLQKLEDVIAGLEGAWAFYGGMPQYLEIDNFPAAVVEPDPLNPVRTRGFLEYAPHGGFIVDPARPSTGQAEGGKGRTLRPGALLQGERLQRPGPHEDQGAAVLRWSGSGGFRLSSGRRG